MKITVKLTWDMDDAFIESMEDEFPSYISYWGEATWDEKKGTYLIWEREMDGSIDRDGVSYELGKDWVARGLSKLLDLSRDAQNAGLARQAMKILREDYDAESLDCLVQAAIFGELRYG